jgi:hypothetical protein
MNRRSHKESVEHSAESKTTRQGGEAGETISCLVPPPGKREASAKEGQADMGNLNNIAIIELLFACRLAKLFC